MQKSCRSQIYSHLMPNINRYRSKLRSLTLRQTLFAHLNGLIVSFKSKAVSAGIKDHCKLLAVAVAVFTAK